jgi:hypothetical protein
MNRQQLPRTVLKRIALAGAAATALGCVLALTGGTNAMAATPPTPIAKTVNVTPSAPGHAAVQSTYKHGEQSVQLTITNGSNQVWALNTTQTQLSSGHWADRAAMTLDPGAQTTVTAYTDDPADLIGWSVVVAYQIPDGHFAVFQTVEAAIAPNSVTGGWASKVNSAQFTADWITACPNPTVQTIGHGYHPSAQVNLQTCAAA